MRQYNYGQIDEHIQWLVKMMSIEYPNNYELVITSNGGEIKSAQCEMNFLSNEFKNNKTPLLEKFLNDQGGCKIND